MRTLEPAAGFPCGGVARATARTRSLFLRADHLLPLVSSASRVRETGSHLLRRSEPRESLLALAPPQRPAISPAVLQWRLDDETIHACGSRSTTHAGRTRRGIFARRGSSAADRVAARYPGSAATSASDIGEGT